MSKMVNLKASILNPDPCWQPMRQGVIISLAAHILLLLALSWLADLEVLGPTIIASGPDGTGDGLGNAVEVGIVSGAEWLKFRPRSDVSTTGTDPDQPSAPEDIVSERRPADEDAEVIPRLEPESATPPPSEAAKTTDRPVTRDADTPYSADRTSGASPSSSALIGTRGAPTPGSVRGGVGIGGGSRGEGGIPGGSEYGRRLQQALIGYYRLTPRNPENPQFVVVRVRIRRDGRILSLEDGRLRPEALIQASPDPVIQARVTAALLELDRHPIPFPPGFLRGASEATAAVYFQH